MKKRSALQERSGRRAERRAYLLRSMRPFESTKSSRGESGSACSARADQSLENPFWGTAVTHIPIPKPAAGGRPCSWACVSHEHAFFTALLNDHIAHSPPCSWGDEAFHTGLKKLAADNRRRGCRRGLDDARILPACPQSSTCRRSSSARNVIPFPAMSATVGQLPRMLNHRAGNGRHSAHHRAARLSHGQARTGSGTQPAQSSVHCSSHRASCRRTPLSAPGRR